MKNLSMAAWIAFTLSVVGALNWGLVGFLDFNLVSFLFKGYAPLVRGTYALVGLSGLYAGYNLFFGCSKG